jgi:MYXO-CTERM domain-containing protein
MQLISLCRAALGVSAVICLAAPAGASVFGVGGLVVFQAGDGTAALANNSPFSIIELTTAAGQVSPVQSFAVSVNNNQWTSATATSTGYLNLTEDRSSVMFDAHIGRGSGSPLPNANTILPRGVGSISGAGGYSLLGTYTGASGSQARTAAYANSGNLFIGDQGGMYATGGTAPTLAVNSRSMHTFGGTSFVLQQSTVATTIVVSSIGGTPAAPTATGLTGLTNSNTAVDFYMVASAGDANYDLLYISTTTGISKFQNVAGAWNARGTATVTGGLFGLAARLDPAGGVDLFATTGGGANNANSVTAFVDSSAPGANISLGAGTVFFTTPSNTTLKGIELAPVPTPGSLALLGLAGLAARRRRR